jgi:hypothetical protein
MVSVVLAWDCCSGWRTLGVDAAVTKPAAKSYVRPLKHYITAEQAVQAVRVFEDNLKLAFSSVDYNESPSDIEWLREERYELRTIKGPSGR